MIKRVKLLVFLIVILSPLYPITADADGTVVFQYHGVLDLDETFFTDIMLVPYALHSIESEINVTSSSIIGPIVTVALYAMSEFGGSTSSLHRGDHPYFNRTWTPTTTYYNFTVRNEGEVDNVQVNVVITQLASANTEYFSPSYMLLGVLAPLIVTVVLPAVLTAVVLVVYRKRHTRPTIITS